MPYLAAGWDKRVPHAVEANMSAKEEDNQSCENGVSYMLQDTPGVTSRL